jgi:hypothetical protein
MWHKGITSVEMVTPSCSDSQIGSCNINSTIKIRIRELEESLVRVAAVSIRDSFFVIDMVHA